MKLESKTVVLKSRAEDVFNFLSNLDNLEQLMPEDKISKWKSDGTTCSFKIKGLAEIGMQVGELIPSSKILINSHGTNPFRFTLSVDIKEDGEGCTGQMIFDADVNAFMGTMIKGPLGNFFNMLVDKLEEVKG